MLFSFRPDLFIVITIFGSLVVNLSLHHHIAGEGAIFGGLTTLTDLR